MDKRYLRVFFAFLLVSLLLGACSGASTTEFKAPLRVSWTLWPGYYPMVIAVEKGLFEKHGVQVEPVFYKLYNEQAPALASGRLDGSALTLNDVLRDSVAKRTKVVLITDNSNGADQIVAAADIADVGAVRGKRIGMVRGTFGEFFVREMLDQNGISPAEVTFYNAAPEAVPDSIPGVIDLGHTYEPYTSQARAKGYNVIFSSAETPGLIVDIIAFRTSVLQERPEDVKAFIAAWFEALEYWQANPVECNAIIARVTGQKAEEISSEGVRLFDLPANLQAFKAGNDTTSVYFTARKAQQFLISTGDISSPVRVDELLDAGFLK